MGGYTRYTALRGHGFPVPPGVPRAEGKDLAVLYTDVWITGGMRVAIEAPNHRVKFTRSWIWHKGNHFTAENHFTGNIMAAESSLALTFYTIAQETPHTATPEEQKALSTLSTLTRAPEC